MKSMYAIAMALLVAFVIGGSVAGFRTAENKVHAHEAGAAESAGHGHDTPGESAGAAGAEGDAAQAASADADGHDTPEAVTAEAAGTEGDGAAGADTTSAQEENATATAAASGDAAAGQTLFASSCGGCHGANAEGGMGPALTENAVNWSQPEFARTLREGISPHGELAQMMPRFSEAQLSEGDLNNIYAFVQSLK